MMARTSSRRVSSTFFLFLLAAPAACHAAQAAATTDMDTPAFVPPPPPPGSEMDHGDRAIFDATRKLKGTERWALAAHDSDLATPALLDDFSCAAGFRLDAARAPHLATLLERMKVFIKPIVSTEKKHWHRNRPFVEMPEAPLCLARPPGEEPSFAYPSGHTTDGWATALLLARLMPERATGIMERGRIFGESRVVCGVHWATDVWAGYMNGATLFSLFASAPDMAPLFAAAQADVAALAKTPAAPDPAICRAEHNAAMSSPLTQTP
ncbi:acid phosphatase [Komagataeibacter rhaeticus]|uniref:acid phosphatase n=1 Tax=Komagataeibacter rhaeticus TaxID=215221 RepID=UPI001CD6B072|nr:phosphatase PAP2 family protein [Komagataeibacter rhaeticus]